MMLNREKLLRILHYNPNTGVFTWMVHANSNGAHVGQTAGCLNGNGYVLIGIDGKKYMAATLAWFYVHGEWVRGLDHRDGDRTNNRIKNLRKATAQQQRRNSGLRRDNTTGFKGVSFDRERNKYYAYIICSGKMKNLGRFATFEEACAARDEAETKLFGEFKRGAA